MRVKNDHWNADQYIALASNLFPGVTLSQLVSATDSNAKSVLYRLQALGLAKPTVNAPLAADSCGWNWLNKVRMGKFIVLNKDGSVMVDLYPIIKAYGWKQITTNTLLNGLYRFDPFDCQIKK
ncbi:hypothetical protein [Serratia phage SMP]|uniref:Uncharacterized protein n=1 Tax=Serratia phage SMP TaxID=2982904 RepID=A0A9E8G7H9_9CAUD|nr:hypothetical protein [Serratia phage SMP]